jgi:hypothetical protein
MSGNGNGIKRPLGIKLVAAFYFLESAVLAIAAMVGYFKPDLRPMAEEFIVRRVPFIKEFDLTGYSIMLAPLLVATDAVLGLGIFSLQKWTRLFIVCDLSYRIGDAVVAAAALWAVDRKMLSSIVSTPTFLINATAHIAILLYLLDPDTKRVFRVKESDW